MANAIEIARRLRRGSLRGLEPAWALLASWHRRALRSHGDLRLRWRRLRYLAQPGTPSQIHLSWVLEPCTSLTLVWYTPGSDNPALVEYRRVGEAEWVGASGTSRASPEIGGSRHRATIADLAPGTEYEYRVSSDRSAAPAASQVFRTRTAPLPGSADVSFAFLCDTGLIGRLDGNATGTRQVIDELLADDPLFVLGGGDYAYANRDGRYADVADAVDAWFEQMQPLFTRCPLMAQYGNHEVLARLWSWPGPRLRNVHRDLEERFEDWAPRFAHPHGFDQGKNYSFEVADAHITALFVPGAAPAVDQLDWLDADLAQARGRGKRWLIVFQHQPIHGHGSSHPANPEVRKALVPILERHRVDLHLSGHDQNYERTYPLVGGPDEPRPTSSSKTTYAAGSGVVYAKVSPGGKMSELGDGFSRFGAERPPFVAVRDDTAHHYALVTLRAAGELEVSAYSVVGDGSAKTLLDRFRIVAAG